MQREFELSAWMNSKGYRVELKINGRSFSAQYRPGSCDAFADMMSVIAGQLQSVYGDELYTEYWKYVDIHDVVSEVRKLIISLNTLYQQRVIESEYKNAEERKFDR